MQGESHRIAFCISDISVASQLIFFIPKEIVAYSKYARVSPGLSLWSVPIRIGLEVGDSNCYRPSRDVVTGGKCHFGKFLLNVLGQTTFAQEFVRSQNIYHN